MGFETLKKLPVEQRVEEAVEKAHQVQPKLNAVVTFIDPQEQLAELKKIPQDAKFYGMPIILKDNVNTKGILTTASSKILNDYYPIYNAAIVDKLQAAGAIVIGKSSMDELAMGGTNLSAATGPVNNPYDLSRISGGSSGGSAVLVASNVVPFAIGTDTGDSVRKPASYNGIVGVKPTYGRISRYGIIPYSSSLDHVGYFTQNIKDAALALEVLSGRDDRDMTSSYEKVEEYSKLINGELKGKKIAVMNNVYELLKDDQLKKDLDHLIEEMRAQGASVELVDLDKELMRACLPVYFIISNCEATANHSNLDGIRFGLQKGENSYEEIMTETRTAGFTELIRKRFIIGSYGLFADNQEKVLRKAQKVRRLIVNELHKVMESYDVLIAPASLSGAPKSSESSDQLSDTYLVAENYMCIANFSGDPSLTLPLSYLEGMPVGLNVTGKAFKETELFDIALGIEKITGLADKTKEVI